MIPMNSGNEVSVLGVQHPAEIVNYRSIGATPVLLAGGLALGAVCALGLALVASVRHRRRDFALLKSLGFTKRGLALTVAFQASVIAADCSRRRAAPRHRIRTRAVDALRRINQRGARTDGASALGRSRRHRCLGVCQCRGGDSRETGRSNIGSSCLAI